MNRPVSPKSPLAAASASPVIESVTSVTAFEVALIALDAKSIPNDNPSPILRPISGSGVHSWMMYCAKDPAVAALSENGLVNVSLSDPIDSDSRE